MIWQLSNTPLSGSHYCTSHSSLVSRPCHKEARCRGGAMWRGSGLVYTAPEVLYPKSGYSVNYLAKHSVNDYIILVYVSYSFCQRWLIAALLHAASSVKQEVIALKPLKLKRTMWLWLWRTSTQVPNTRLTSYLHVQCTCTFLCNKTCIRYSSQDSSFYGANISVTIQ